MGGFSPTAKRALKVLQEELRENEYVVLSPEEARKMVDSEDTPQDLADALDWAQGDAEQGEDVYILVQVTKN